MWFPGLGGKETTFSYRSKDQTICMLALYPDRWISFFCCLMNSHTLSTKPEKPEHHRERDELQAHSNALYHTGLCKRAALWHVNLTPNNTVSHVKNIIFKDLLNAEGFGIILHSFFILLFLKVLVSFRLHFFTFLEEKRNRSFLLVQCDVSLTRLQMSDVAPEMNYCGTQKRKLLVRQINMDLE